MKLSNIADINKELKLKINRTVYLLYGKDEYLKDRYIEKITKIVLPNGNTKLNHNKLDEKPMDMNLLEEYIDKIPFGGNSMVILNDLDISSQSDKEIDKLISIINDVPSGVVLVIVVRNDNFDAKKSARAKKILASAEKVGLVLDLGLISKNDLVSFIKSRIEKSGGDIPIPVAHELIDWCSDSLDILINEIDKLISYANGDVITSQMVWDICSLSIEGNIYQISKKMLQNNLSGALSEINALIYNKVDPIRIVTTLGYSFADFIRVKYGMNNAKTAFEIAKDIKKTETQVNYSMRDVKNIDISRLASAGKLILDSEYSLKTGSYNNRIVLEQLVIEVTKRLRG